MQINSTSPSVAQSNIKATETKAEPTKAAAEISTLKADTVSISAEAQDAQLQSGSGDGVWPKKPK